MNTNPDQTSDNNCNSFGKQVPSKQCKYLYKKKRTEQIQHSSKPSTHFWLPAQQSLRCSRAQVASHQDPSVRELRWIAATERGRRLILHQGWVGLIHLWSITPLRHWKSKCAPQSADDACGLEWKCPFKVMMRAVTSFDVCCIGDRKFHHSSLDAYKHSPVQLNTCFFLKLSPELIAFLHHLCVEIFLIGFPYDPGLAMRAPSGVGQNKLGKRGNSKNTTILLYVHCLVLILLIKPQQSSPRVICKNFTIFLLL